ncbi:MAG TPA: hypothetical protein DCM23_01410 [Firmicutes bacterium]|jgi:dienelactone hydrolase|nr:hypothetical protein [Bacillota bacterium]
MDILLIILGVLVLIQIGILLLLFLSFNHRGDNDKNLKYFTHEDFDDLDATLIEFPSRKHTLRGYIYRPKGETPHRLMVFNMGIGAGHHAYMHVIRAFVLHDYTVVAYDYTGCQMSDGKRMGGLPQALLDFQAVMEYIATRDELKSLPIDVVGHSWGGYVTGIAPRLAKNIRKVISMSGFNRVPEVIASNRPMLKVMGPFVDFANYLMFGPVGVYDIASSIRDTNIPMLFIAGSRDPFIDTNKQINKFQLLAKNKPLIEFHIEGKKNHNPYLSEAGEAYFIEVLKKKRVFDKKRESPESQEFYKAINYDLITENDENVFKVMFDFLDK